MKKLFISVFVSQINRFLRWANDAWPEGERAFDETKITRDIYKGRAFMDALSDLLND